MANPKNEARRSSYLIFFPLLFIMLILEIVHLPALIAPYRPDFLALLLIFFASSDPKRINVGWAWCSGLLLDLLSGAPLGFNALILAFQVYIILSQFKSFISFMLWQQIIIIGIVNLIGHIVVYWAGHLIAQGTYSGNFGWPTVVTMVLWPFMMVLLVALWRVFNIVSASVKVEKEI
ncbi:MAG TPA: rod shape-determining protein MreD [Candidatus Anaerobiospirillum stercoravium]|nr:rod shape-determining protein MreD [Candidatus Anaerobiospirillum stercoravium]